MRKYQYGSENAGYLLVQPIDVRDTALIENEIELIKNLTDKEICFIAYEAEDWNRDLSPWASPAVFANKPFGGKGADTLDCILSDINGSEKTVFIGGYSLAGLFALWAAIQSDAFLGVAAASPSVWFPGFTDYLQNSIIHAGKVYLSLGRKEPLAKNPVMATVGEEIEKTYAVLAGKKTECVLEWNDGNHFQDAGLRTAKAFAWLLNN